MKNMVVGGGFSGEESADEILTLILMELGVICVSGDDIVWVVCDPTEVEKNRMTILHVPYLRSLIRVSTWELNLSTVNCGPRNYTP